jgi:hypothetical protein
MTMAEVKFEQWANVELMGHQRAVGRCSEQSIAGSNMLRVDIPDGEGFTTQYFSGGAIYRITPVTEAVARKLCAGLRQDPPFVWELKDHPKSVIAYEPDEEEDDA